MIVEKDTVNLLEWLRKQSEEAGGNALLPEFLYNIENIFIMGAR